MALAGHARARLAAGVMVATLVALGPVALAGADTTTTSEPVTTTTVAPTTTTPPTTAPTTTSLPVTTTSRSPVKPTTTTSSATTTTTTNSSSSSSTRRTVPSPRQASVLELLAPRRAGMVARPAGKRILKVVPLPGSL